MKCSRVLIETGSVCCITSATHAPTDPPPPPAMAMAASTSLLACRPQPRLGLCPSAFLRFTPPRDAILGRLQAAPMKEATRKVITEGVSPAGIVSTFPRLLVPSPVPPLLPSSVGLFAAGP